MKRVIKTRKFVKLSKVIISLLMVGIALSCSNEFEAIEMNKNTMYIPNSGGSDTIRVLNCSKISLTGEAEVHLNDSVYWVSSVQNGLCQLLELGILSREFNDGRREIVIGVLRFRQRREEVFPCVFRRV